MNVLDNCAKSQLAILRKQLGAIPNRFAGVSGDVAKQGEDWVVNIDRKTIGLPPIERRFNPKKDLISIRNFNQMLSNGDVLRTTTTR